MQPLITPVHKQMAVETLEAAIRKTCGAFDLEPMARTSTVAGDVATRRVGFFDTAVVALDARHVQRGARAIRQDPGEHLFLLIQDEGHCRVEQGERSTSLAVGDMFLVDSVRPSSFVYDGSRSNQISIHMPREEMLHRFGSTCTGGVAIGQSDPLWLAIRAVITKLLDEPSVTQQLSEALLCLLGAYFQGLQNGGTTRSTETLLSRALALIDRHCADPDFGAGDLARLMNVSERMLQRHFEPLGETPRHRLLNRRLDLARTRLANPRFSQPAGIAAIAYDAGFNDLSYFYREFRKKYGVTPGAITRCH